MAAPVTAQTPGSSQRTVVRAPRAARIRWDRVGRIALLGMLGMIVLLYVSPAKHWVEQSSTRAAQREELSGLSSENAALKRRVRALEDPSSLEQEARRLGMVKRGERSYVIKNPSRR